MTTATSMGSPRHGRWRVAGRMRAAVSRSVGSGSVTVPVSHVTACALGGADRSTLFITTMRHPGEDGRVEDRAGALFACTVDATGRPSTSYAG